VTPTRPPFISPSRRLRNYLRTIRLMVGETRDQVYLSRAALSDQLTRLETLAQDHAAELSTSDFSRKAEHSQLVEILSFTDDQGQSRRQRLREFRAGAEYERAYVDADPLVSVVIPTFDNHELLRERSIPSALAQTHENIEIVVVGDAAPEQARVAAESFGDPRITFFNLPYRGPYPDDPHMRWLVAGVPPYNEAVRRASGLWIAPLDDDDAFRPHHIERLLAAVREERLELAYGQQRVHFPGGATATIGRFPPELGQFGIQSTIYHAGLAEIFELELADGPLGVPYDWALCLRMQRAGVRIGMVEEATADYYPSRRWTPRWTEALSDHDYLEATDPEALGAEAQPGDPEWEYVPEGWDARGDREGPALGWGVEDVARAYREKWPRFLRALEGPGPLGVYHEVPTGAPIGRDDLTAQNTVLAYGYALARAACGSKQLSMLDWGGALGHYYVIGRRLLPEVQLEYHCRELPAVCIEGREVLPEATFHDSDECLDRRYDLVLASSSLQYAEDWRGLLRRLAGAAGAWVFLTRVPVAQQHGTFVVLQRAHAYGYGTEYLGWVLGRDELLDVARDVGLELEREFVLLPGFQIAGAPDQVSQCGFLFRVPGGR
jgi:putative methyltransferase (TIGR04325 family)